MKLSRIQHREDCFDGSMVFAYVFDQPIGEPLMLLLAAGGDLDFHPEFARPFFKIFTLAGLQLKGIIGDMEVEAVFPRSRRDGLKGEFEAQLRALLQQINGD